MSKPLCKVHGRLGLGQMCSMIIVGGKHCGATEPCGHKEEPRTVVNFHVQATLASSLAAHFEQAAGQMEVPASVQQGGVDLPLGTTRHQPPQDIIEAAYKVGKWFEERGLRGWKLGPCMDRSEPAQQYTQYASKE